MVLQHHPISQLHHRSSTKGGKSFVIHKDTNMFNNCLYNLDWETNIDYYKNLEKSDPKIGERVRFLVSRHFLWSYLNFPSQVVKNRLLMEDRVIQYNI